MNDPLTAEEKDKFWSLVRKRFDENYSKALSSGGISEEDVKEHDHILARCILQITATDFEPLSPAGKKMLRNLELFV